MIGGGVGLPRALDLILGQFITFSCAILAATFLRNGRGYSDFLMLSFKLKLRAFAGYILPCKFVMIFPAFNIYLLNVLLEQYEKVTDTQLSKFVHFLHPELDKVPEMLN